MVYRKISVELVAFADEADAVVAELNSAIDRLEETHAIFGGDIESVAIEKSGSRRKSALMHSLAAGDAEWLRSSWPATRFPVHAGK